MRNTQRKGDIAVANAIVYFTEIKADVSVPMTESAPYDLIVDINGELLKIQCKYSTSKQVDVRRIHSNSKGYVVKKNNKNDYDWLYVYFNKQHYIVKECLFNRSTIDMSNKYLAD